MPAVAVAPAHRRHDISDRVWEILEPLLPGGKGKTGRPAQDNRRFINAVFWILRTGAPWRDLPPDYGDWKNTHRRFCRWRDRNVWAGLLEAVMDDPDYEWLMLDASYINWTLRILSGINEGICNTMVQSGGEFLYIGVGGR